MIWFLRRFKIFGDDPLIDDEAGRKPLGDIKLFFCMATNAGGC